MEAVTNILIGLIAIIAGIILLITSRTEKSLQDGASFSMAIVGGIGMIVGGVIYIIVILIS